MKKITLLVIAIFIITLSLFAQNDTAKIAEAKYALEKMKDCNAAKQALDEVSEGSRSQPLYVYYMAKTLDCLKDFDGAIKYYTKYLEFVPDNAEITQRLAELSFAARKYNANKEKGLELISRFLKKVANQRDMFETGSKLKSIKYTIDQNFDVWAGNTRIFKANLNKVEYDETNNGAEAIVHIHGRISTNWDKISTQIGTHAGNSYFPILNSTDNSDNEEPFVQLFRSSVENLEALKRDDSIYIQIIKKENNNLYDCNCLSLVNFSK